MQLHAHGMPCAAHEALTMVERRGPGHGSPQAQVEGHLLSCCTSEARATCPAIPPCECAELHAKQFTDMRMPASALLERHQLPVVRHAAMQGGALTAV